MMDFKDQIRQFGERVEKMKDMIRTEEATKNALIMPFIQCLGYDVFNPMEVVPEFVADIGIKKGEKVDYAIIRDNQPVMLIECKHWGDSLNPHNSQLFRYYHTTHAKFALLTNGIIYRFYTDLNEINKMDEKPFLELNITDLKDNQIDDLRKFHKSYFDVEQLYNNASELFILNEFKSKLQAEFSSPSEGFIKLFAKQIYQGPLTAKVLETFTAIMRKGLHQYQNELITDRLKTALDREQQSLVVNQPEINEMAPPSQGRNIETTQEELEGFHIVKSLLRKTIKPERIVYRDAQTYFAILLDDNNRKPICRLYLNGTKRYLGTFDDNRKEIRNEIMTVDDLFNYHEAFNQTIAQYDTVKVKQGREQEA